MHSFLGLHLLINSEFTIEEDSGAPDEHSVLSSCVPALGKASFEEFRAEGSAMTVKQAAEYALGVRD